MFISPYSVAHKTGSCSKTNMPSKYTLRPFWDWLDGAALLPNDFVPDEHKNLIYWTREVSGYLQYSVCMS